MAWLEKVEADFEHALAQRGTALFESLKGSFGERVVTRAAKRLGTNLFQQSSSGNLGMARQTGHIVISPAAAASAPAISIPRHNFYGRISKTKAD